MNLIPRTAEKYLRKVAEQYPVVTVTGPRQSGKTTLCRSVFVEKNTSAWRIWILDSSLAKIPVVFWRV